MSFTKTVWFIRHGESVSNANLPTRHPADSELTPQGVRQAELAAAVFTTAPDLIVVSPYIRAGQTAAPTRRRFPQTPVAEWPVHEFSYLHPGRYNGTTGSERGPWAQAYWERRDPFEKEGGGGESFAELMVRVQTMQAQLRTAAASFIAVFSHGLFLRAFIWMHLTGVTDPSAEAMLSYRNFVWGVRFPNCAILRAELGGDSMRLGSIDIAHLPQEAQP